MRSGRPLQHTHTHTQERLSLFASPLDGYNAPIMRLACVWADDNKRHDTSGIAKEVSPLDQSTR